MLRKVICAVLLSVWALRTDAAEQACGWQRRERPPLTASSGVNIEHLPGGLLIDARDECFTLKGLVDRLSPVLWFAPNEPLFARGIRAAQLLPSDVGQIRRAVYFKLHQVIADEEALAALSSLTSSSELLAAEWSFAPKEGQRDARLLNGIRLKYFFYFEEDFGYSGHIHDLEGIDVLIVRRGASLRVARVAASAHGISSYTNEFDVGLDADLVAPLHVFCEAGKHASAPDPNADGVFDVHHDVNATGPSAWGVRDQYAIRWRTLGAYRSWMTLPRDSTLASTLRAPTHGIAAASEYDLHDASDSADCYNLKDEQLRGLVVKMFFCGAPAKVKGKSENEHTWRISRLYPIDFLGVSGRSPFDEWVSNIGNNYVSAIDDGHMKISVTLPLGRLKGIGGWLGVRRMGGYSYFNSSGPLQEEEVNSLDVLYYRNLSRLVDGYFGVGWDYTTNPEYRWYLHNEPNLKHDAVEIGVKLSIPLPISPALLTVRAAFRHSNIDIGDRRYVILVGWGPW